MLYMIGMIGADQYKEQNFLIKIGYASNVDKRIMQYKSHNPLVIPMYTIAGTKALEKKYHSLLSSIGKKYYGEWFLVSKIVFMNLMKRGFYLFPLRVERQYRIKRI